MCVCVTGVSGGGERGEQSAREMFLKVKSVVFRNNHWCRNHEGWPLRNITTKTVYVGGGGVCFMHASRYVGGWGGDMCVCVRATGMSGGGEVREQGVRVSA